MASMVAKGQPTADTRSPSRTTMEENDMIRNAWIKRGATCNAIALVAVLAGCTDEPIDPTGNWNLTLSWGGGTCGFTGTTPSTLTVTQGPNGYLLAEQGATVVGTITCTEDKCSMSVAETGNGTYADGTPYTASVSSNLSLDANAKVTGSGQIGVNAQDGSSCSQTFTATGTKS